MGSIKTKSVSGDVSVGRNVAVGGRASVSGSFYVGHHLRVDGWLDAPNIKGPNKGVFLSASALKLAYPSPRPGWFAGVGSGTPFAAYVAVEADGVTEWVSTGGEIDLEVDMVQWNEDLDAIRDSVGGLESSVDDLRESRISEVVQGSEEVEFRDSVGSPVVSIGGATSSRAGVMTSFQADKLLRLQDEVLGAQGVVSQTVERVQALEEVVSTSATKDDLQAIEEVVSGKTDKSFVLSSLDALSSGIREEYGDSNRLHVFVDWGNLTDEAALRSRLSDKHYLSEEKSLRASFYCEGKTGYATVTWDGSGYYEEYVLGGHHWFRREDVHEPGGWSPWVEVDFLSLYEHIERVLSELGYPVIKDLGSFPGISLLDDALLLKYFEDSQKVDFFTALCRGVRYYFMVLGCSESSGVGTVYRLYGGSSKIEYRLLYNYGSRGYIGSWSDLVVNSRDRDALTVVD